MLLAAEATPAAVPGWPPFPAVYGPRYWPDAGVVMERNTVLTTAQTRTLYETGLVPALGNSGLPYAGIARGLHTSGELRRAAQMGGCVLLGIRDNAVWSPKLKKMVRWVWQTYYPLPTTSPFNRAVINRICSP